MCISSCCSFSFPASPSLLLSWSGFTGCRVPPRGGSGSECHLSVVEQSNHCCHQHLRATSSSEQPSSCSWSSWSVHVWRRDTNWVSGYYMYVCTCIMYAYNVCIMYGLQCTVTCSIIEWLNVVHTCMQCFPQREGRRALNPSLTARTYIVHTCSRSLREASKSA